METFYRAEVILKVAAALPAAAFLMLNSAGTQHPNFLLPVWALFSSHSPSLVLGSSSVLRLCFLGKARRKHLWGFLKLSGIAHKGRSWQYP